MVNPPDFLEEIKWGIFFLREMGASKSYPTTFIVLFDTSTMGNLMTTEN